MASAVIGALRVNLGIDTAAFGAGLSNAQGRLATFGKSVAPAVTAVAALGAAAGMAGAALVGALVKNSLDSIDTQSKLAAKLGATVVGVQALDQAANLAGISAEDMAKSMGVLNARLGEAARTGSGSTYEAFKRLGLSLQELSAMDADERLAAIADQMQALGYTTQQQADFLRQVGIRSQDMITVMQGGGDAIRDARKDVEDFGIAVSDIDAKKIEMANDAITQIGVVAAGVGNQIAIRLSPYILGIATGFTDAARSGKGFGEAIELSINSALKSIGWLLDAIKAGDYLMDNINLGITGAARATRLLVTAGLADVSDLDETLAGLNKKLNEFETSKMPSEELDAFIAKAKEAAEVAAKLQLGGDGDKPPPPPPGPTEADQRAAEQYQQQLSAKLEQLQTALLTERQAEQANYAERMTDLNDFLAQGLITKQAYAEMALAVEKDHVDKVKQLDRDAADEAKRAASVRFNAISSLADSASSIIGTLFEGSKAAAIAQTVINTGQAIMATLAQVPAPWGYAVAAGVAATGAAQIAMMNRTNRTSGGSSVSASKAAAPSAPTGGETQGGGGSTSTLFVQGIRSDQLFSGDAVRDLSQKLLDYQADGGKVVLGS